MGIQMDIGPIIDHPTLKTENDLARNLDIRPFFSLLESGASQVYCSQLTYTLLRGICFRSVYTQRVSNKTDKIAVLVSYF
jgi:hypothetical protein